MIELRHFKHIVALARFKNFRLAAESVFISQPALSLSIKASEKVRGQKLFVRANKTIVPTAYGMIVLAIAEKVIADVSNMQKEIDLMSGTKSAYLKISLSPYIHYSISDRLIERFMKMYPEISLDLI